MVENAVAIYYTTKHSWRGKYKESGLKFFLLGPVFTGKSFPSSLNIGYIMSTNLQIST